MARFTVLLADDDTDFLTTTAEFLEREGYRVVAASNPSEARKILTAQNIDVAVLDLRLTDSSDENDISGLIIAREVARQVPKIILTAYPTVAAAREALSLDIEGLPAAVDLVLKTEGVDALAQAIRKALVLATRFRKSIDATSAELDKDNEHARTQAILNYVATLLISLSGVMIIYVGTVLVLNGMLAIGIVSGIVGVIAQSVSFLFFRRVDAANERMDRYHLERLQVRYLEILLTACEELPASKEQACKSAVIEKASMLWLRNVSPDGKELPTEPTA